MHPVENRRFGVLGAVVEEHRAGGDPEAAGRALRRIHLLIRHRRDRVGERPRECSQRSEGLLTVL